MYTVVMLLILAVGTIRVGLESRVLAIRTTSAIAARAAAEAGLTKAIYQMNQQFQARTLSANQLPSARDELLMGTRAAVAYDVTSNQSGDYVSRNRQIWKK